MSDEASEEWRGIVGFPDYEVSSFARVRRATPGYRTFAGRIMHQWKSPNGYLCVGLGGKTASVHRLVCSAFHGEPPFERAEAAHNDGDKGNNSPGNLRWASRRENMADIKIHGTENPPRGEMSGHAKLSSSDVIEITQRLGRGERICHLAREYQVTHGCIGHIKAKRNWKCLELGDVR